MVNIKKYSLIICGFNSSKIINHIFPPGKIPNHLGIDICYRNLNVTPDVKNHKYKIKKYKCINNGASYDLL